MKDEVVSPSNVTKSVKSPNKSKKDKKKVTKPVQVEPSAAQPKKKAPKRKLEPGNAKGLIAINTGSPKKAKVQADTKPALINIQFDKTKQAKIHKSPVPDKAPPKKNAKKLVVVNQFEKKPGLYFNHVVKYGRVNKKEKVDSKNRGKSYMDELNSRRIHVINIPPGNFREFVLQVFKKYGRIETGSLHRIITVCNTMTTYSSVKAYNLKDKARNRKREESTESSADAFITFEKKEGAVKALAANGSVFKRRTLIVEPVGCPTDQVDRCIFVQKIPIEATADEIKNYFNSISKDKVASLRVVRRPNGASKGMATILFEDAETAQSILSLGPLKMKGRTLKSFLYTPRHFDQKEEQSENDTDPESEEEIKEELAEQSEDEDTENSEAETDDQSDEQDD